jgi:hypothetical protein
MDKRDDVTDKTKSRIEGGISIAYFLVVAFLLKGTGWFFGDGIISHFGEKAGAFTAYILVPLSLLMAAVIVSIGSYFVISFFWGKETAEAIIFRWRKPNQTD